MKSCWSWTEPTRGCITCELTTGTLTDSGVACIIRFAHAPAIVGWGINLYPQLPLGPAEWRGDRGEVKLEE